MTHVLAEVERNIKSAAEEINKKNKKRINKNSLSIIKLTLDKKEELLCQN